MPDQYTYDVFLSHNSKDKPVVRRLAERLRQAGLRVWFDEWIIKPGDDIYLSIERGLEATRTLVLCLSPAALGSEWVGLERSTVLFRDPSNKDRRFIPLLLTDCQLPDTLRRYKYVDFRKEADASFEELLTACQPEEKAVPPAPQPKPEKKAKPAKQSERLEPLAVLERKLTGHTGWVRSVAVSPDGKWAASGSKDKTVKVWDLETGECRATLEGHQADILSVNVASDGERILSSSNDGTIRTWDPQMGKQLASLKTGLSQVHSFRELAEDGHLLVSGTSTNISLWDSKSGNQLMEFMGHNSAVVSLALIGDKKRAVSGSFDETLKLWNFETGECLTTLKGHSDIVNSVQITPDGRYAVSGSNDKTVKVWALETGTCVGTLEGHQNVVQSVALSPDGTLIASTGWQDYTVRLWDWKSGACLQVIEHQINHEPISVAFSPDGSRLLVGTAYACIYVYRLSDVRTVLPAEPIRRYVNAKVVLIGESTVGKTTLAHRLIEDCYVKTDSTHGMNVWRLDLPLEQDETMEREALLWDLAGQEDYRLIHQLYLEETALALLLINPQKDDPFAEAVDWLKALRAAVTAKDARRDVARLLIPTRLDVGGMKVSQKKIDRFLKDYGFLACLPTSAKRGDNCSDKANGNQPSPLKQLIAQHVPWDKLPWTSTPRLLAEIKNAVVSMRDQADIRLLRFAELVQRLEQALPKEKFGEAEVRTAVTLLANHGLVRPLKFGDLVLLRPDLLNGYAGAIIRAARSHKDEIGCVPEDAIYREDFDFTGVERLKHRPDEELLLRALVQTFLNDSLCIAEDTPTGRHLVFPSQYRRERDIPKHPDIFVSYTFTGEWQTVYTTLVVRLWYSREFQHRELWRNAAEFETPKQHALGLRIDKTREGEATIGVFFDIAVPDELKVIFIEYIHRHLEKYAREVSRDRRYVCACGKSVTDLDEVRKRLAANKDFIYCQGCDEKVPLIDFIEQRLKSDPIAARVLGMDAKATQELDAQALEQILTGHMLAICGEANQIFRELTKFDYGIDGEIEFKDNNGKVSGKKIYVQLKSGASYLRTRKADGKEIFDVKNPRHLDYWVSQPVDVYLVIRDAEETIRWMNVTRYLKMRKDKKSRQIVFEGEKLDMKAVWEVRDQYISRKHP